MVPGCLRCSRTLSATSLSSTMAIIARTSYVHQKLTWLLFIYYFPKSLTGIDEIVNRYWEKANSFSWLMIRQYRLTIFSILINDFANPPPVGGGQEGSKGSFTYNDQGHEKLFCPCVRSSSPNTPVVSL